MKKFPALYYVEFEPGDGIELVAESKSEAIKKAKEEYPPERGDAYKAYKIPTSELRRRQEFLGADVWNGILGGKEYIYNRGFEIVSLPFEASPRTRRRLPRHP